MNHYAPLQVSDGKRAGKWVYTTSNHRVGTYPVGYCVDCEGHATKEEACEHYRRWLLDNAMYLGGLKPFLECKVCGAPTDRFAELPRMSGIYPLCAKHPNREQLEQVVEEVEYATASV